jgi:hypothetical protein
MGADMKNMCGCVKKATKFDEIQLSQGPEDDEELSLRYKTAKNNLVLNTEYETGLTKNDYDEKNITNFDEINKNIDLIIQQKGGEYVSESQFNEFNFNEKLNSIRQQIDFFNKFELTNSSFYEKGPVFFKNSNEMYKGSWDANGIKSGYGILKASNNCYYEGFFDNDMLSGEAIVIDSKGDYYKGTIVNGKAEGLGEYVRSDGTRYYGQWINDLMQGSGTETFENGIYKGEFMNGEKNGYGELELNDGSKYNGQFKDNCIHGQGTFVWNDGRVYQGYWEYNKMHGKGVFRFSDGRKYEGEYRDDVKEGKGRYYWSEDKYYDGEFLNGKRHGYGMIYNNGKTFKGLWKNGKMIKDKDLTSMFGESAS